MAKFERKLIEPYNFVTFTAVAIAGVKLQSIPMDALHPIKINKFGKPTFDSDVRILRSVANDNSIR